MRRRFDNGTKKEILCKRVVRAYDLAQRVARKEVQEPRFLLALLPTFPVGALRKYAGGIFLASDLSGYAAETALSFQPHHQRARVPQGHLFRFAPLRSRP